jgi:hypothetical protein
VTPFIAIAHFFHFGFDHLMAQDINQQLDLPGFAHNFTARGGNFTIGHVLKHINPPLHKFARLFPVFLTHLIYRGRRICLERC